MTPAPVARLEMNRIADWERHGSGSLMPRSSLTPILRFADVESFLQEAPEGSADPTQLQGFVQVGVAKEDQPHYLRVLVRPGIDATPLIRFGLGVIGARAEQTRPRPRPRGDLPDPDLQITPRAPGRGARDSRPSRPSRSS